MPLLRTAFIAVVNSLMYVSTKNNSFHISHLILTAGIRERLQEVEFGCFLLYSHTWDSWKCERHIIEHLIHTNGLTLTRISNDMLHTCSLCNKTSHIKGNSIVLEPSEFGFSQDGVNQPRNKPLTLRMDLNQVQQKSKWFQEGKRQVMVSIRPTRTMLAVV